MRWAQESLLITRGVWITSNASWDEVLERGLADPLYLPFAEIRKSQADASSGALPMAFIPRVHCPADRCGRVQVRFDVEHRQTHRRQACAQVLAPYGDRALVFCHRRVGLPVVVADQSQEPVLIQDRDVQRGITRLTDQFLVGFVDPLGLNAFGDLDGVHLTLLVRWR